MWFTWSYHWFLVIIISRILFIQPFTTSVNLNVSGSGNKMCVIHFSWALRERRTRASRRFDTNTSCDVFQRIIRQACLSRDSCKKKELILQRISFYNIPPRPVVPHWLFSTLFLFLTLFFPISLNSRFLPFLFCHRFYFFLSFLLSSSVLLYLSFSISISFSFLFIVTSLN